MSGLTPSRKVTGELRDFIKAIFLYTNCQTDVTEKFFARLDVTEEFLFRVTKPSPYFDR